jgi:ATP-dependent RNA helicase RhlE
LSSARAHSKSEPTHFARFGFHPSLLRGLSAAGFTSPRPIQEATIPACLDGRDVMGLAQTGTGKTAAFALPILQRLIEEPGRGPLVLILAPTRELALQIHAEIELLARFVDVRATSLIGGVPMGSQLRALHRDPEIVVGCPGRVLDLIRQNELETSGIDTLVLDEADHMFDMGFLPDLRRILQALPAERQNLLFSATMPKEIRRLANEILDDPHVVELAPSAPAETVTHGLYETDSTRKRGLLDHLLAEQDCSSAIVFTRTKHRAKRLAQQLERGGRRAVALQGNMSQPQRERAMKGFRGGEFDVLVATDIAARGIDVAGVDYVINYDPPSTAETYTHRIGRTGRAGASGRAVTFVTPEDRAWVRDTERMLGAKIERFPAPDVPSQREAFNRAPHKPGRGSNRLSNRDGKSAARNASSQPNDARPRRRRVRRSSRRPQASPPSAP